MGKKGHLTFKKGHLILGGGARYATACYILSLFY